MGRREAEAVVKMRGQSPLEVRSHSHNVPLTKCESVCACARVPVCLCVRQDVDRLHAELAEVRQRASEREEETVSRLQSLTAMLSSLSQAFESFRQAEGGAEDMPPSKPIDPDAEGFFA